MMALSNSQQKWREIFERQQLANAERWLDLLEKQDNPTTIILDEHDNLLRTLEATLQTRTSFNIAYRLIEKLFPIVIGYGDWERWHVYLEQALSMSQELCCEREEANLLSRMGHIWTLQGEFQQAHELFSRSMKKYEDLNDNANYASTLTKLAAVNDSRGQNKESLALLEEALRVSSAISDLPVLMEVNLALSSAYHKSRKWQPGLSAAKTAYELAGKLGDKQKEMWALLNMIAIHTELGNWQDVENLSPKIEYSLTASGDLIKLSHFKNNTGVAAFSQGHFLVAEKAWQDALRINLQINHSVELARSFNNLGMVYTKLGELETAEDMLLKAAAIFEEKEDAFNRANTLDNLADVYKSMGNEEAFQEILRFALSLLPMDSAEPHIQDLVSIINGRLDNTTLLD